VCVWLLADLLQTPELTAKPGLVAMYRRYRDQVSPAGFIAPYGDAGGAHRPFTPDWPMDSAWAHYVAAFERAASAYHDPSLRWAAAQVAQAGARHMPLGERYTDIESLFYSSFAAAWAEPSLAPQRPQSGTHVLRRREADGAVALDKLILAPGRMGT
jgi:hypothetical protein